MAEVAHISLRRPDGSPWGFRIHGGQEFGVPVCVHKVHPGSPADQAGLRAGDVLLSVQGRQAYGLRHKDIQDTIGRSGAQLDVEIQRGAQLRPSSVLQPTIKSVPSLPGEVLDTSKVRPAPMSLQRLEKNLSSHTEILSTGVVGINFMKPQIPVNVTSEVLKLVLEEDVRKDTPSPCNSPLPNQGPPIIPSYQAKPAPVRAAASTPPAEPPPGSGPACSGCGRFIMGPYVRASEKNLHPECFRCTTCGLELKNAGYHCVAGKLYCEIHAGQAARFAAGATPSPPRYASPDAKPASPTPISPLPFNRTVGKQITVQKPSTQPFFPSKQTVKAMPYSAFNTAPTVTNKSHPGAHKFVWPPKPSSPPPGQQKVFESLAGGTFETDVGPEQSPTHVTGSYASSLSRSVTGQSEVTKFSQTVRAEATSTGFTPFGQDPAKGFRPISMDFGRTQDAPQRSFSPVLPPAPAPVLPLAPAPAPLPPVGLGSNGPKAPGKGMPGILQTPRRGRGTLNPEAPAGTRIPVCAACTTAIRGPFIMALGRSWCLDHFQCANSPCKRSLQDVGFVEEQGLLYCEHCFEEYLAPACAQCGARVKRECLLALEKSWHPECFKCSYCKRAMGNDNFYLEDGAVYCEKDWLELFTTKCVSCGFPIEAGDRWLEAMDSTYHVQCFTCALCHKSLEGQGFLSKGGKPICKSHARFG